MKKRVSMVGVFGAVALMISWAALRADEQNWLDGLKELVQQDAQDWVNYKNASWRGRSGPMAEIFYLYAPWPIPRTECSSGSYGIKTLSVKGEYALRYLKVANQESQNSRISAEDKFSNDMMKVIYFGMFKENGGQISGDGKMNLDLGVDYEPIPWDSSCQIESQ